MEDVYKFVGLGTACVIAVAWVARTLITHLFSSDLERHKATLAAENAIALERIRSDYARLAVEHETRFKRVDDEVAKHLVESLRLLHKLYDAAQKLVAEIEYSGGPSKDDLWKLTNEANKEFNGYYFGIRCYVPPALDEHIRRVAYTLSKMAGDFARSQRGDRPQGIDYWAKAADTAEKVADPLFSLLVKVIRKRLGVEDTPDELELLSKLPVTELNSEDYRYDNMPKDDESEEPTAEESSVQK